MAQLMVGGVPLAPPVASQVSPQDLFDRLCDTYSIDKKVGKPLVCQGLRSLEDFKSYFAGKLTVEDVVATIQDVHKGLQAARLRQALDAISKAESTAASRKADDEPELDRLLPSGDLKELREAFWTRYKLNLPAFKVVSDALLSRLANEINRRLLQVHDLLKMKTLAAALKATKEKRKLGLSHMRRKKMSLSMRTVPRTWRLWRSSTSAWPLLGQKVYSAHLLRQRGLAQTPRCTSLCHWTLRFHTSIVPSIFHVTS